MRNREMVRVDCKAQNGVLWADVEDSRADVDSERTSLDVVTLQGLIERWVTYPVWHHREDPMDLVVLEDRDQDIDLVPVDKNMVAMVDEEPEDLLIHLVVDLRNQVHYRFHHPHHHRRVHHLRSPNPMTRYPRLARWFCRLDPSNDRDLCDDDAPDAVCLVRQRPIACHRRPSCRSWNLTIFAYPAMMAHLMSIENLLRKRSTAPAFCNNDSVLAMVKPHTNIQNSKLFYIGNVFWNYYTREPYGDR